MLIPIIENRNVTNNMDVDEIDDGSEYSDQNVQKYFKRQKSFVYKLWVNG